MRVLVYGGREYDDWETLASTLNRFYMENDLPVIDGKVQLTIIEGGAKGADFLARVWAKWRYLPFEEYPADWKTHGKGAGHIRNQQMIDEGKPDVGIGFPGGTGTADMTSRLRKAGIKVIEVGNGDLRLL